MSNIIQKDIFWFEIRRLVFNFILIATGLLLLIFNQFLLRISSHTFYYGYLEVGLFYVFIANVAYTGCYVFIMIAKSKININAQDRRKLNRITFVAIMIVTIVVNSAAALYEYQYRKNWRNHSIYSTATMVNLKTQ
jgi:chromate transport protein ChrA